MSTQVLTLVNGTQGLYDWRLVPPFLRHSHVRDGSSALHLAAMRGCRQATVAMLGEFARVQREYVSEDIALLLDPGGLVLAQPCSSFSHSLPLPLRPGCFVGGRG